MPDSYDGAHEHGDDGTRETVRMEYDWTTENPSTAIVRVVSVILDREPESLAPLFESVDPTVIDSLIRSADGTDLRATLQHGGVLVTVAADGEVTASTEGVR